MRNILYKVFFVTTVSKVILGNYMLSIYMLGTTYLQFLNLTRLQFKTCHTVHQLDTMAVREAIKRSLH